MNAPTAWSEHCRTLTPAIVEACATAPVAGGPGMLSREIARRIPDRPFREVLCRGGWYRLGGVVGRDGARVADSIEAWVGDELERRDGDLARLHEDFAGSGLAATRFAGRTHYFIAPTGAGAGDFLQLEIEDLQESLAHPIFDREPPAGTLDELVDARSGDRGPGTPLGLPVYRLRRLCHVGDVLNGMRAQSLDPQPIHRFVADWEASSAGRAMAFCNHWVVALREHLDRYRNALVRATPVPAINGAPPAFAARQGSSGLALCETLNAYDRQVGYPLAWFFHLLTTRAVPHWVAVAVADDAQAGFSYLPARDLEIVRHWLHRSYAF